MQGILLVEDEEDIRTLLETALRSAGYHVDSVRTETAAQIFVKSQPYDLVLTDWKLGGEGNGIRVADAAVHRGAKTLVVTGFPLTIPEADRARHEVLAKPFRLAVLMEAVERLIGPAQA